MNKLEWTHYICDITATEVCITDETLYQTFDRIAMTEKYGSESLIIGRMCIRVGEEWAWRMTCIADADIVRRDAEVAAFMEKHPNLGKNAHQADD